MAATKGMSQSTVSRIWRAFALAPHRSQTSKLSTDPLFIDKVRDVVGLYLDPPEKALVLCVDKKSQIQALDRSQPVLPMTPGVPERRSHDYIRAGTTTLFAALEVATGKVIGSLHRRHRAAEFKKFLAKVDKEVPAGLQVHLILDHYAPHKTPDIQKWLLAHPRFHLHFTPTTASWVNLVERWFAELTQKKLKRGVHRSVQALERDIRAWLTDWNNQPRPFIWTKTADEILDKVAAYCHRISDSGHKPCGVAAPSPRPLPFLDVEGPLIPFGGTDYPTAADPQDAADNPPARQARPRPRAPAAGPAVPGCGPRPGRTRPMRRSPRGSGCRPCRWSTGRITRTTRAAVVCTGRPVRSWSGRPGARSPGPTTRSPPPTGPGPPPTTRPPHSSTASTPARV
ncbi:hypothetical protein OV450_3531 [Actinobacteria bacterium OV450]|nr:hypothetical protein OV450_3531 [Actinobacteria bacterium OV450]